jgi:putative DNA primase/helicase
VFGELQAAGRILDDIATVRAALQSAGTLQEVEALKPIESFYCMNLYSVEPTAKRIRELAIRRRLMAKSEAEYNKLANVSEPLPPDLLEPQNYTNSDAGNSERFINKFGNLVRYSVRHGTWLIWDGMRWAPDDRGKICEMGIDSAKSIYEEARKADKSTGASLAKWALQSQDQDKVKAMLFFSRSKVAVLIDELDRDPWRLNCLNGTINLKTGQLLQHDPQDLITKIVNVRYEPEAECPTWHKFLNRVMDGNDELISFLQRAIGYSLTGKTTEQALFILHGNGANGKSTFLETITRILGDGYAAGTPTETIMMKHFDSGIPNDVARLKGARFVTVNEVEAGRRLAESKVKQMTGGDTLTARFMRGEFFDFVPEYKLWIRANHKPDILGTDNAIWRRIRLIPFEVQIPPEEQDPDLVEKLVLEYSGILDWAVAGCLKWQEERLNPPQSVKNATEEYREEMDRLGNWLIERTIEMDTFTPFKMLFTDYLTWCEENNENPIKQKYFSQSLAERGYSSKRVGHKNVNGIQGIALLVQEKK